MTAVTLARSVGITENAVRKIESGDSKEPRLSTGLRIAEVFGVSPLVLTGKNGGARVHGGPDLAVVIRKIRDLRDRLRKSGVEHPYVFGSVARGDAESTSDIDVMVEPAPDREFSLIDLGTVDEVLGASFPSRVDVLTLKTIQKSRFARESLEDAVLVF
jgi:predicted nucleotidyltransferase